MNKRLQVLFALFIVGFCSVCTLSQSVDDTSRQQSPVKEARAHARTGDAARIAGYLGRSDSFDKAIEEFSIAYADQTERDHAALVIAIRAKKLPASLEGIA